MNEQLEQAPHKGISKMLRLWRLTRAGNASYHQRVGYLRHVCRKSSGQPVSIYDAALFLNVSEQTMRRWIRTGRFPAAPTYGELLTFMRAHRKGAAP